MVDLCDDTAVVAVDSGGNPVLSKLMSTRHVFVRQGGLVGGLDVVDAVVVTVVHCFRVST